MSAAISSIARACAFVGRNGSEATNLAASSPFASWTIPRRSSSMWRLRSASPICRTNSSSNTSRRRASVICSRSSGKWTSARRDVLVEQVALDAHLRGDRIGQTAELVEDVVQHAAQHRRRDPLGRRIDRDDPSRVHRLALTAQQVVGRRVHLRLAAERLHRPAERGFGAFGERARAPVLVPPDAVDVAGAVRDRDDGARPVPADAVDLRLPHLAMIVASAPMRRSRIVFISRRSM